MGCCQAKDNNLPEERIILTYETRLGYGFKSAAVVDLLFRKFSSGTTLKQDDLDQCIAKLSLNLYEAGELLTRMKTEDSGRYRLVPLLVLGFLLASDRIEKKATLLFEAYDVEFAGELPLETIQNLVGLIFEVSCEWMVQYVLNRTDLLREELSVYMDLLRKRQAAAIGYILEALPKTTDGQVKKSEFVQTLAQNGQLNMLTPHCIRLFMLNGERRAETE